ncbi:MAG: hypothetical protein JXP36_06085, partial [Bacteroidales bacterium]|nr:hypothetical protein [Bacteroidales bacterium]
AEYESDTLNIIAASDSEKAIFLQNLLKKLLKKNKSLFEKGISVTTRTNFPVEWGLGSSSTLINNLAQWAETDAFEFFFSVSSGSGYDIACANATNPIIYKRTGNNYPEIQRFDFNNELMKNMYLVYSGQKKATEQHVKEFLLAKKNHSRDIIEISAISDEIVSCNKVSELIRLIENHEEITGRVLLQIPVKQKNFDRFEGAVKSLGAWGGDFYLAVSENDSDYVQPYFEQFGLTTILPFNKTVLY